jgi:hypothetical protein
MNVLAGFGGEAPRSIPFLKGFTVFNVEQCESLPADIGVSAPPLATHLILPQVEELKGEQAAHLILDLKKADMAREAERLLDGTGWLPEPLRLRIADVSKSAGGDSETLPAFLTDDADGDPALPHPIFGALIEDPGNGSARLIWRRDRKDDG